MDMELELDSLVQWITVFTIVFGAFNYAIIRPLKLAIDDLRSIIAEVKKDTEEGRKERHMMEVKLAKVEDAAKSAHHRIDTLEQKN